MAGLPDDALVVRGGQNFPDNFARASGATVGTSGELQGVSVNAGTGLTVDDLALPDARTGYPGILNNQIGVTTVGEIRARGGDVVPSPTRANPHHATLSGLTPEHASELFRPTAANPARRKS
jgi:hypothetical protein